MWSQSQARSGLASWLPGGKGTDRGAFEVDLVNSFVDEIIPLVSEEGGEWTYRLGAAEKVLHDLLNGDIPWPEDVSYEEQIAYVEGLLEEESGGL